MKKILDNADSYRRYVQRKSNAHYLLADNNKVYHKWLGILATLSSSVVGSTIVAGIIKQANTTVVDKNGTVQIIALLVSVAAIVLSALQTFFKFSDISQQHKQAAASYESLRHKLDIYLLTYEANPAPEAIANALEEFKKISDEIDKVAASAPTVPNKVWDKIKGQINIRPILDNPPAGLSVPTDHLNQT